MGWRDHKYQRPAWVSRYLALRYQRHGRGPSFGNVGYDCHGFLMAVYAGEAGVTIPTLRDGEDGAPDLAAVVNIIDGQGDTWREIAAAPPPAPPLSADLARDIAQPLDLLILDPVVDAMHCGVYIGAGEFVHMLTGVGVHVSRLDNGYWRGHLLGIYRARAMGRRA